MTRTPDNIKSSPSVGLSNLNFYSNRTSFIKTFVFLVFLIFSVVTEASPIFPWNNMKPGWNLLRPHEYKPIQEHIFKALERPNEMKYWKFERIAGLLRYYLRDEYEEVKKENGLLLHLNENRQLNAFAFFQDEGVYGKERVVDLSLLAVSPESRGNNLGKSAMDFIHNLYSETDVGAKSLVIRLEGLADNEGLKRYYGEKLGFSPDYIQASFQAIKDKLRSEYRDGIIDPQRLAAMQFKLNDKIDYTEQMLAARWHALEHGFADETRFEQNDDLAFYRIFDYPQRETVDKLQGLNNRKVSLRRLLDQLTQKIKLKKI